jgi:hypothetical protein
MDNLNISDVAAATAVSMHSFLLFGGRMPKHSYWRKSPERGCLVSTGAQK